MKYTLDAFVTRLNRAQRNFANLGLILLFLRALFIAIITIAVWAMILPQNEVEQISLGILTLASVFFASLKCSNHRSRTKQDDDLLLALEIEYGLNHTTALTNLNRNQQIPESWKVSLDDFYQKFIRYERKRYLALASSLTLPLLIASITTPKTVPSFRVAIQEVSKVVSLFNHGATLRILQGATNEPANKDYQLAANSPVQLELLAQNLIEITLSGVGPSSTPPIVELRRLSPSAISTKSSSSQVEDVSKNADTELDIKLKKDSMPDDQPISNAPLPWEKSAQTNPGSQINTENATTSEINTDDRNKSVEATTTNSQADSLSSQSESTLQRFQMMTVRSPDPINSATPDLRHQITFAVSESVELFIPTLSANRPLARLIVRQLPIPKVSLTPVDALHDPWPDDQPLNLKIRVSAEHSLQLVRLLIKSGSRVAKELVANVMTEDRNTLTTEYRLHLEPYVESDLAQVEIVAEAVDRSLPTPLIGQSRPLRINTASAYGRYKVALETLRKLKTLLDETISQKSPELSKEAIDLANQSEEQSDRSPFFDGLDRVQIHRFRRATEDLSQQNDFGQILDLSQSINDFLFEHEILDDRERDRDFFVATRSLSRILEQTASKRPMSLQNMTSRLHQFLDDRHKRWQKRVERLAAENTPPNWQTIHQEKPFHKAIEKILLLDANSSRNPKLRSEQMTILSKTVSDYRAWIEALEAHEDKSREQQERQRQEGLASARNALRELQQRQGEVSAELDRADQKTPAQMSEQWISTKLKQASNVRDTKQLEGQMRALAPSAGARIEAAIKAMEATLDSGNQGNYAQSESNSDLAGRLLRQAERSASQSQQRRQSRGRRRRVTGDNYYGQSVVGDDIEINRNYEVERRYREDILDEIQDANLDEDQRALLENYLRQIVR